MKKINYMERFLMIFLVLQPFLDFYLLYSEKITNIFKFSPTTIVRIVFIGIFLIYTLFRIKYNKKYFWILGYLLLIGVYSIFHVINSLNFNTNIGGNFSFSYITELFYFIRLFLPILLVFLTYNNKITNETFSKTILFVSLIFSLEIIITNLFKISLTSYEGNNFIKGNFFDWFSSNNKYQFFELASRGFFYMANQISAVLIMLLPINIYYAIKTNKKCFVFSAFCLSLSMIMLGTRVATFGWLLVSIAMFFAWIFFAIIHKNKIGISKLKILLYIILTTILIFITMNSPLMLRKTMKDYENKENDSLTTNIINDFNDLKTNEEKIKFILKNSELYSIPNVYVKKLYPCLNDSYFWIETMKLPYSVRGGNRNIQNLITKRVSSLNNNKYDKFFGMGYSRFRNAKIYIEQDFIVHYYTLGIFGIVLFFFPYIAICIFSLLYMLIKGTLRMKTVVLCLSTFIVLGVSYFSGHTLDELIVTLLLGYICGYILILTFKKENDVLNMKKIDIKNNKNKKVSIVIPVYNAEKYIEKCLDSLINQTLDNIEIIAINDGSKDNTKKILDDYASKYENIIVKHIKNGGVANARNVGIQLATGEYIGFIDSDDHVDFSMYEKLYNKAIQNNYDVVACDARMVYPKVSKIIDCGSKIDIMTEEDKKKFLIYSYAVIWNKIYKRSLVKNIRFKDKSNFCEDVEFLYRVLPLTKKIGVVKEPLYNYIQHEGSLTYVYDKKLYQLIENFDGLYELYNSNNKYKKYMEEFEYSYVRYLYATFIKRLAKTKNKDEFNKGVSISISKVNDKFPNYKKNKYISKLSLKNIYFKMFNSIIADLIFVIEKNRLN